MAKIVILPSYLSRVFENQLQVPLGSIIPFKTFILQEEQEEYTGSPGPLNEHNDAFAQAHNESEQYTVRE